MGGAQCIYYTVLLLNMTIRLSTLVDYPLHPEYPLRFITLQPYILGNLEGLVPPTHCRGARHTWKLVDVALWVENFDRLKPLRGQKAIRYYNPMSP